MNQRTEAGSEEDAGWSYDTLGPWQLASCWHICIGSKMEPLNMSWYNIFSIEYQLI